METLRVWLGAPALALAAIVGLGCASSELVEGTPTGGTSGTGASGTTGTVGGAGSGGPGGDIPSTGAGGFGGSIATGSGGTAAGSRGGSAGSGTGTGNSCGVFGGRSGGGGSGPSPRLGPTMSQPIAPPAVSGGTLRVLADGVTIVASDPDRDRVYVVDLSTRALRATVALQPGDEPGRVIVDDAGRAHVALRGGGALATLEPGSGALVDRRAVCPAPRGLAHEAATGLVHVACAGGELVSLPAAGGPAVRTLRLERDLRDVIVQGSRLRVSRFRSAELLTIEADGSISDRISPPMKSSPEMRGAQRFTAGVAWQTTELPGGGVMMLHQRGVIDQVVIMPGGYGGRNPCDAIVHPAVTTILPDGTVRSGPALPGMVLAVDAAVAPDGRVAFVSFGNANNQFGLGNPVTPPRVFVSNITAVTDSAVGCRQDGTHGPCFTVSTGGATGRGGSTGAGGPGGSTGAGGQPAGAAPSPTGGIGGSSAGAFAGSGAGVPIMPTSACGMVPDPSVPQVVGEPIAVAFAGDGTLVVQSREPAMLTLSGGATISLSDQSRADTGHQVFHANAGGSIACASCHAEGDDDGRVWNFSCIGARRTQSLQVGLRGTEPFHWSGDEADLPKLMQDVFVGRMSGPALLADQTDALLTWIDSQPRPHRTAPSDATAVERGRALFNDAARVGCTVCHSGARFSSNATVDVGTGGLFQVPSLLGVGTRGPFMHNGCAPTLRDRFVMSTCGGGDRHGVTSQLGDADLSDLVAYLESL